jgi:hypothetical protein
MDKAMGLQKGRSDMVLYFKGRAYHIELKTPDGVQSADQKKWQAVIIADGFDYVIIRSLQDFQHYINGIIK